MQFFSQTWSTQGVSFNKPGLQVHPNFLPEVLAAGQLQMEWRFVLDLLGQMCHIDISPDAISFSAGITSCFLGRVAARVSWNNIRLYSSYSWLLLVEREAMSQSLHRNSWASFNITRPWRLEIILGSSCSPSKKGHEVFPFSQQFFLGCHVDTNHQDVLKVTPGVAWVVVKIPWSLVVTCWLRAKRATF